MRIKINEFFNKKTVIIILFIIITIISIIVRIPGINFISEDFRDCINPWIEYMRKNGGMKGTGNLVSEYSIPYIALMAIVSYIPGKNIVLAKISSIIFDYFMAIGMAILITRFEKKDKWLYAFGAYALTILLPTVMMNSSIWAQCDAIYTSFVIWSLIYLIDEKYMFSFILLGIACAFKLQFIFILPIYVLVALSKWKEFPWYYFGLIIIVYFIMCIPVVISGNVRISECLPINNVNLTGRYSNRISLNFPGFYNLILKPVASNNVIYDFPVWLPKLMVVFALAIFAIVALIVLIKKIQFDKGDIISIAIWSVLVSTFFLPYMHERYIYIAEVLAILYMLIYGKKRMYVTIFLQVCSICTYCLFLWKINIIPIQILSCINLLTILLLTVDIVIDIRNKKGENSIDERKYNYKSKSSR